MPAPRLLPCRCEPPDRPSPSRLGRFGPGLIGALVLGVSGLAAQGTPAGTRITLSAWVTFEKNGVIFVAEAETDGSEDFVVARVGGTSLEPPGASTADPGSTVIFPHVLRNIGNAPDTFSVAAVSSEAWPVRIYRDLDGNGRMDPGEPLLPGPVALEYAGEGALLVAVDIPNQSALRGRLTTVRLTGHSHFDPSAVETVTDQLRIRASEIVVSLEKSVDRSSASAGDLLTYTIAYQAEGVGEATEFRIADPIPAGTRYVAGTLRLNGAPLSDAPGVGPGHYDPVANQVEVSFPRIAAGDQGTISFQVRVSP